MKSWRSWDWERFVRQLWEGDVINGTVMAGQIAGLISREQTCKEMIEELMEQALGLLKKGNGYE